jgi:hypothetical protein
MKLVFQEGVGNRFVYGVQWLRLAVTAATNHRQQVSC